MPAHTQFHVRFTISHVGAQARVTPDVGPGGVILIAASSRDPRRNLPLVLVVDTDGLGLMNPGASVTNTLPTIVTDWRDTVAEVLGRRHTELVWIQLDSDGHFDNVLPSMDSPASIQWSPITAPGAEPRSAAAFCAVYPDASNTLLRRLGAMTGVDLRPARLERTSL